MSDPVGRGLSASDAAEELEKLRRRRPYNEDPVRVWVAWFEEQPPLWDVIAAYDATLAPSAQFVADHLRRKIKDLQERFKPDDRWPEASKW